jgi:serine protease AprX
MRGRVLLALVLLVSPPLVGLADAGGGEQRALVTLERDADPAAVAETLAAGGVEVRETYDVAGAALVEAPPRVDLASLPGVAHATADEELDPHLSSSKGAAGWSSQMREAGLDGDGVNVAIVDSGVDADHPGLDDRVTVERTFSPDGSSPGQAGASAHGSHVAGIAVGTGEGAAEGREDVAGMAPAAGLVSLDISPQFTTSNALRAFEWLYDHHEEHDVEVLVNAWGRDRSPATYQPDDPLVRATDALVDDGVTVVFSAGNTGPAASNLTLEAANPSAITVGAVDDGGELERYSSRGPVYDEDGDPVPWTKPDLVAPGAQVVSVRADPGDRGNYVTKNGTSMAAPHVAGAAALLLDVRPDLAPEQVAGVLLESAASLGEADNRTGHGMLDVAGAVEVLDQVGQDVEERSRSREAGGELTGVPGPGESLSRTSVSDRDTVQVSVPTNATGLDVELAWDGRGGLEVHVVDPGGTTVQTATVDGEGTVRVAEPRPGTWRVEVEPEEADRGRYEATVEVTWLVEAGDVEIPIARQAGGQGSFPATDALGDSAPSWAPFGGWVPMVAGALLTGLVAAGTLRAPATTGSGTAPRPGRTGVSKGSVERSDADP